MHKLLVVVILLLPFIGHFHVFGQQVTDQSKEHRPKPNFQKLTTLMNLDQSTAGQLKELMDRRRQEMKANHRKNRAARQERKDIHDSHRQELSLLLDDTQMEIFELYMKRFKHGARIRDSSKQ